MRRQGGAARGDGAGGGEAVENQAWGGSSEQPLLTPHIEPPPHTTHLCSDQYWARAARLLRDSRRLQEDGLCVHIRCGGEAAA